MIRIIIIYLSFLTLATSCSKNKKICVNKPITKELLNGDWFHDYDTNFEIGFVAPPKLGITFTNDSFYLVLNSFSDIIADTNGCPYLNYKEYMKGKYLLKGNVLNLYGVFCENDFNLKIDGCYRKGLFVDSFKLNYCDNTLFLNWYNPFGFNPVEHREIKLLKK